jgi:hypothetical protein
MTRTRFALLSAIAAVAVAPTTASAAAIELGATTTPLAAPSCPSTVTAQQCTIILTETTALPTASDGVVYPTTVTQPGRIVAFTVGLAKLTKAAITGLNTRYGGTSQVQVTVLHPINAKKRLYSVTEETPQQHAEPYFGQVTEFPLLTTLPVTKGDVVALTVSTWAPVLAIGLAQKQFQYRASRATGCTNFNFQTAQLTIGMQTNYLCFYVGTRVEFSATEITDPVIPTTVVKSRRHSRRA